MINTSSLVGVHGNFVSFLPACNAVLNLVLGSNQLVRVIAREVAKADDGKAPLRKLASSDSPGRSRWKARSTTST
jgi:hypothetical protein